MLRLRWAVTALLLLLSVCQIVGAFQSDELPEDDDEWGIVGAQRVVSEKTRPATAKASSGGAGGSSSAGSPERFRSTSASDKKVQFDLEHSFGGSQFSSAGVFTARLRESLKSGQTLSKFRLVRNQFASEEKKLFEDLLKSDGLYTVRVPANVLSPGNSFAISSVKARCLAAGNFNDRFDLHMDQGNVIGITYSSSTACPYPRVLQTPSQWTFDSLIIIKSGEQAWRSLLVPETLLLGDEDKVTEDGTPVKKIQEKSFWAKYWMYIVPVGLILLNAITQIANMPEEGAPGQGVAGAAGGGGQQRVTGGGGGARRR